MEVVRLDTMVTVVDSSVFLDAYMSRDAVQDRPELGACHTYHDLARMGHGWDWADDVWAEEEADEGGRGWYWKCWL